MYRYAAILAIVQFLTIKLPVSIKHMYVHFNCLANATIAVEKL